MSIIRTCLSCDWKFPEIYKPRKCMFCGGHLSHYKCNTCKEWAPTDKMRKPYTYCKKCWYAYQTDYLRRHPGKATLYANRDEIESFAHLLNDTKDKNKPLTESEWLEACRYFGGCAICGKDEIAARTFFVKYKDGGRYTSWNIYPTCDDCGPVARDNYTTNPYLWLKRTSAINLGMTPARAEKLKEYIRLQIEKVKK